MFCTLILLLFSHIVKSDNQCLGRKNCILANETKASSPREELNMLGSPLSICSKDPLTGYNRSGFCNYLKEDRGRHLVCAEVSKEFLSYTKSEGNDLESPNLRYGFKGLKPGDRWCLCVSRVEQANLEGINLKIIKEATNQKAWD